MRKLQCEDLLLAAHAERGFPVDAIDWSFEDRILEFVGSDA